ncbi:hypothetical protein Glove_120g200 [Diversispora epigaea]|uniref:Uncharacterized protein n=1 Tax=Diversispora epigaea TaxID=1348612 RepID=A0A397IZF5_9GLOM|nr:hypothetical protein Glove_120g200 [Diversispora epigaea]
MRLCFINHLIKNFDSYGLEDELDTQESFENNEEKEDIQDDEKSSPSKAPTTIETEAVIEKELKQLPSNILKGYLTELGNKIENLISPNIHEFLINFFKQNLTGEDWHKKIDDLHCSDPKDSLMASVINVVYDIFDGSTKPFAQLKYFGEISSEHLLVGKLMVQSSINYEFGEICNKYHAPECADGVGYLNNSDKYM